MKIVYFGSYDPSYARVRITLQGLKKNGISVVECNSRHPYKIIRLCVLLWKLLFIVRKIDVIFVNAAGQSYVFLAKIFSLFFSKPLVFDAFISYYHVLVCDLQKTTSHSLVGRYYFYLDYFSCLCADIVTVDTQEHMNYFHETFNIPFKKLRFVPVGSDDAIYYPREMPIHENCSIFCVSSFYPLHGMEYVVDAAHILEKKYGSLFSFVIVGDGPMKASVSARARALGLSNVHFYDRVSPEKLVDFMSAADICLGQFGNTQQAQLVIPTKVYDAFAMKKAVITGKGAAVEHVFLDKEVILFCEFANPQSLADAIYFLYSHDSFRSLIASRAYDFFCTHASSSIIGRKFATILQELN